MKKLFLLPFLVFGQFIANAQKATQRAQHVITLNLMPAGPVHLPKKEKGNNGNGNGKDKNIITQNKVELSQDKQTITTIQVVETITDDKNKVNSRTVIYTATSL